MGIRDYEDDNAENDDDNADNEDANAENEVDNADNEDDNADNDNADNDDDNADNEANDVYEDDMVLRINLTALTIRVFLSFAEYDVTTKDAHTNREQSMNYSNTHRSILHIILLQF